MEVDTEAPSRTDISRRQALKRGAILGGALWAAPMVKTIGPRAVAQQASPEPGKRFITGGGMIDCDGEDFEFANFGLKLNCIDGPRSVGPGENLTIVCHKGEDTCQFKLESLNELSCTPAPPGTFDTAEGTGTGTLNCGSSDLAATISFKFQDLGSGMNADEASFTITAGDVTCACAGKVDGQIQAHES